MVFHRIKSSNIDGPDGPFRILAWENGEKVDGPVDGPDGPFSILARENGKKVDGPG